MENETFKKLEDKYSIQHRTAENFPDSEINQVYSLERLDYITQGRSIPDLSRRNPLEVSVSEWEEVRNLAASTGKLIKYLQK